jgi:hypothetical protein
MTKNNHLEGSGSKMTINIMKVVPENTSDPMVAMNHWCDVDLH